MIVDLVYGFLGSGKTTFIRGVLQHWGKREKIVVLVNEFGDVGIDGDLLAGHGGDVIEMPSGCICCSLKTDFRAQLLEVSREMRPDRIIIEPTGVATVSQLRSIVGAEIFEDTFEEVHNILVVDGTSFMDLFKGNRSFLESQVENAHLILLNKCDRIAKKRSEVLRAALVAIQPDVTVLTTEFGVVDWSDYQAALSGRQWGMVTGLKLTGKVAIDFPGAEPLGALGTHGGEAGLGYETYGRRLGDAIFEREALEGFFRGLVGVDSRMGDVVRAKGVFRTPEAWVLVELASGDVSSQTIRPCDQSKLSVIGRGLDRAAIGVAVARCAAG
ncbi:MAG: GTP-binding protein [Deltaproteobacteria bacterium]|nr:GTP-binding protein [Deltaproteobacteria bacterium]